MLPAADYDLRRLTLRSTAYKCPCTDMNSSNSLCMLNCQTAIGTSHCSITNVFKCTCTHLRNARHHPTHAHTCINTCMLIVRDIPAESNNWTCVAIDVMLQVNLNMLHVLLYQSLKDL